MTSNLSPVSFIIIFVSHHWCCHQAWAQSYDVSVASPTRYCDTDYCDSIVNKCKLTDRCTCDFRNDLSCARSCINCLEEKFSKCCGCVDLCPAQKETDSHTSHVGVFTKSDEQLFQVLTETDDIFGRWSVETQTGFNMSHPEQGNLEVAYRLNENNLPILSQDTSLKSKHCSLAWINKHLHLEQCKRYCKSMGAKQFRWFHDGCCECIGEYCLNFGAVEPNCKIDDSI